MISFFIRRLSPENADPQKTRNISGRLCSSVGIVLNLLLFIIKLVTGVMCSSIAIIADAFNNLTDTLSSLVSLFGFILSGQKADGEHPFGHGRIEYLAGAFISIAIIFVGFELFKTSFAKILDPVETVFNLPLLVVLTSSVLIKLYMAFYNRHIGKKIASPSLLAVSADSISDAVATTVILASAILSHFTKLQTDGYAGALVSLFIIKTGISTLIKTSSPLLGRKPDRDFVKKVEDIVRECPETLGIHDLVVHDYGPDKLFVSLHMEVDGQKELFSLHDAVDLTERRIKDELCCEAVIHMDPIDVGNPIVKELYAILSEESHRLSSRASIHDLRVVPGPSHTNVIFDIMLPPEDFSRRDAVCEALQERIHAFNESYFAVITAEISYT